MKRWHKWSLLTIVVTLVVGVLGVLGQSLRVAEPDLIERAMKEEIAIRVHQQGDIRLVDRIGVDTSFAILCLHGAPGGLDQFLTFFRRSDLAHFRMIAVDRPGYGYSSYGKPETDLGRQSERIVQAVRSMPGAPQKVLIFSHSYGGPVGAAMAVQYPPFVMGHYMLCPVLDPVSEPMFWFSSAPLWWPLRYFSSGAMKAAAWEKASHPMQLDKWQSRWKEISSRTLMVQGGRDWLAPPSNADFVRTHFPRDLTEVRVKPEASHFLPFTQVDAVAIELLMFCEKMVD